MNAVFPITYFGNIAYFRELANSECPLIETKEHFVKQTLRTRCTILTANGELQLTVPVVRKNGSKTLMEDIEISYDTNWRKIHWKAIESAYSSAPFFEHYGMEVEELIFQKETNLVEFNLNITERILNWLSIDLTLERSTTYLDTDEVNDFRSNNFPSIEPIKRYQQVFAKKNEFIPNLSMLDLIFCEGPLARNWIVGSGKFK